MTESSIQDRQELRTWFARAFEESNANRKRVRENEEEEDQPLRRRLREKTATSSKRKHENDGEVDGPERKVFVNKFEVNQEFEEEWADTMDYFDDKTGFMLDGKLVNVGVKEELGWFHGEARGRQGQYGGRVLEIDRETSH